MSDVMQMQPSWFRKIDPDKWYRVSEVSKLTFWSEDAVYDWIKKGLLVAFLKPTVKVRGKRTWIGVKILGSELIRFIRDNLSGPMR